jgi:sarcosine oxidase
LLDNFVARYLPAWAGQRQRADTCRYTLLPNEDFLVDVHPDDSNLVIASPCSGHGFKFASALGEALADLATDGHTALPIQSFSFQRHGFT